MSNFRKLGTEDPKGAIENYREKFDKGELNGNKADTEEFVNNYYDIATDFYEYGWGQSFHFATQHEGETFREAIRRHEYYLALKLGLKPGMKCMDLGCGVGGPALNIARFSECNIVGLNINKYQIARATQTAKNNKMSYLLKYMEGSFLEIPVDDNSYDAVYAFEATCHSADQHKVYSEAFRILKPGSSFAAYEWCMTDSYDPENKEHQEIKRLIELGDALPDIRSVKTTLQVLQDVGFELVEWEDRGLVTELNSVPWYRTIDHGLISVKGFRTSKVGVKSTHAVVSVMEAVRLAPKGTSKCHETLCVALDGLTKGGKTGIFTPALYFHVRKPEVQNERPTNAK